MASPAPRPGILDIATYVPGKSSVPGVARVIKLSSNESALGPSPKALRAYRAAAADLRVYPDGRATELREALGRHHGLDPARIVCGCGSDELIGLLIRAYAGQGDEMLYSAHGFLPYPINALSAGAQPVAAPETDLKASVDALLDHVSPRTRVLALANPNNPTGTHLDRDELARLRAGLRDDILLLIDSAYAEYVRWPDYTAGVELVEAGDNTVMTRTFSKLYALAAMRVGWAYCPPAVADVLHRIRPPFNVTGPSQAAAIAALEDTAYAEAARAHNERWLPWLEAELDRLGLAYQPSAANFLLVRFPSQHGRGAAAAMDFLIARGIIPRQVGDYGLPDCLRISIGTEEEMRALRDALAAFVSEVKAAE